MAYWITIEMDKNSSVGFSAVTVRVPHTHKWVWPLLQWTKMSYDIVQFSIRLSDADLEQGKLQTATRGEMSQQRRATQ